MTLAAGQNGQETCSSRQLLWSDAPPPPPTHAIGRIRSSIPPPLHHAAMELMPRADLQHLSSRRQLLSFQRLLFRLQSCPLQVSTVHNGGPSDATKTKTTGPRHVSRTVCTTRVTASSILVVRNCHSTPHCRLGRPVTRREPSWRVTPLRTPVTPLRCHVFHPLCSDFVPQLRSRQRPSTATNLPF